jgi:methylglutaconyl-CoA hydratase
MKNLQHIEIEQRGAVRWLWLNRPDVRNAFNDALVADIATAFADVEASPDTRVVVVAGRGPAFCAGADLNWMRAMANYSHADNHSDALKVARMFHAVHSCSKPVVARVHGDAFGGGVGLAAACDVVIALDTVSFVLSEVKLGIVAATISPHVVRAALAATKKLLADVVEAPIDDVLLAATAKCIADARVSPEGREGIAAFLEKRAPSWAPGK